MIHGLAVETIPTRLHTPPSYLICLLDMECSCIGLRVDRNSLDAHTLAGADHTAGNLTTVGNEDLKNRESDKNHTGGHHVGLGGNVGVRIRDPERPHFPANRLGKCPIDDSGHPCLLLTLSKGLALVCLSPACALE